MRGERYERPRIEDRTSVMEPLNTVSTSVVVPPLTLAWRRKDTSPTGTGRLVTTRERGSNAR